MADAKYEILEGYSELLGSTCEPDGVNFALFSSCAERVELCLFDDSGAHEIARLTLPEFTNEIWHGFVPGLHAGQKYGYRVHGKYAPDEGLRFNPAKLLLDPYAREYAGDLIWDAAVYGYDQAAEEKDMVADGRDSAPFMPKCVVCDFGAEKSQSVRPQGPWPQTLIYETHVRGMTKLHPAIPADMQGTFDGLGHDAMVAYIRSLGVTAVELLPVHAFIDDHHLVEKGLNNYWGYNTIGFFAPERRYEGAAGLSSFRDMVRKYHDAGIEVILDVVYNHTAEGSELGPTLSFRGIDNGAYYRLLPDNKRHYVNDTGTGNTVNTTHPRVLQMVMDSLRYWVQVMEVDGFRFDLGTILGRELHGFDQSGSFFDVVCQDPVLRNVKLIGEPWDIGPGGYQVGGFPPGWGEWNDQYRDTMRGFWRGDGGLARDFAARFSGSGDIYDVRGRRPWASVNFITAHDGFTLHDLVSYDEKHNEANGEDNRDGHGDNRSRNHGAEGPTDDEAINALRERQKRNLLATLILSHGTPMLLAGDEMGRTQNGNNNVYCQDNEIAWTHWDNLSGRDQELIDFTRRLIALRRDNAIWRRENFRDPLELRWIRPEGENFDDGDWQAEETRGVALLMKNPEVAKGAHTALILFNPTGDDVTFTLPEGRWSNVIDTMEAFVSERSPSGESSGKHASVEGQWKVTHHAMVVLTLAAP